MHDYNDELDFKPEKPKEVRQNRLVTVDDLLLEPEEKNEWLIDNLCITGGVSLLTGKPKSGKSTLARMMAVSISQGSSFLERKSVEGKVLYLALEEKRSELRKHFVLLQSQRPESIYVHVGTFHGGIAGIKELIKKINPALVVVDPLFRLLKIADINDYLLVSNAMENIIELARDTNVHLLLVHHQNKQREGSDGILGSTALFGAVDTAIIMRRVKEQSYISSRQRYGDDLSEVLINFTPEGRMFTLGESAEQSIHVKAELEILEYIENYAPVTEEEITDNVRIATQVKRKVLRDLLEKGLIKRINQGGKAEPFQYLL